MGTKLRAFVALAAAILACAPPAPTAAELLERAAKKTESATSVHFVLVRVGEPVVLDATTGLRFSEATGDIKAPDRVRAKAKVISPAGALTVDVLWLPEGAFVSNPFTGAFTLLPVRPAFDPSQITGATGVPGIVRSSIKSATIVGTEKVGGADAHHIRAEADGSQLSALTGGAILPGIHTIDVWIDTTTFHVLRLSATEPRRGDVSQAREPGSWRLDLSDYDKPVEITKP